MALDMRRDFIKVRESRTDAPDAPEYDLVDATTSSHAPHFLLCLVTPNLAARWLEKNTNNRPLRQSLVHKYARDMQAGHWCLTGEPIKFAADGTLLDGQHRLAALVAANRSVRLTICLGLASDCQISLDTGMPRSMADVLTMAGEHDGSNLASVLRLLYLYDHSQDFRLLVDPKATPSRQELSAYLAAHPAIRAFGSRDPRMKGLLPPALKGALAYLFAQKDPVLNDHFWNGLGTGANLDPTSPLYHLRERLRKNHDNRKKKMVTREMTALVIKAWNAYRQGRPITANGLRWSIAGTNAEPFPRIL